MEKLNGIEMFVKTAQHQSFVATAREFGLSASAVSKSISRLEERIGIRLFQRSTRVVKLTSEGQIFLERSQRILAEMQRAEDEISALHQRPEGRLRIALPYVAGWFLPLLAEFSHQYPKICLDLDFSDRLTDIIGDGFDLAIRTGTPADNRLVSRELSHYRHCLVASPTYLQQFGTPATPNDLVHHHCLHYRYPSSGRLDQWAVDDLPLLSQDFICNSLDSLLYFAEQGRGIACVPDFAVAQHLQENRLTILLDSYCQHYKTFHLVFPSNRHLPPKVRKFIDFMVGTVGKNN